MNKIAVITGASRGIGLALTKKMLHNGYTVIGTSKNGIINAIAHENFCAVALDISNEQSIQKFTKFVAKRFHKITILINNAGVGPDLGASLPDSKSFETTFKVNVSGTVFLTESMIPLIQNEGKIVTISSKMGSIANALDFDSVAYRMSKSALNMYTKILSNRLKDKLFVAALDPGWVQTEIRLSNLKNAPLTPSESADNIYKFVTSNFKTGSYWDTVNNKLHNW
ncbi:SDR family NAD(P)-dependent oxidoreductase [Lutibacter sp. A80]|uniref:SDR family NAD(P)-dependent oxidoreductase n=1 Tax=Lutibacter sp. A80 TaxID=2918453 RepID=UPI001F0708DD|nr:SDR family NAD(P)-dependent oxidoreductase [Lutibacter sp. A80]UMB61148.1 SDR family NAD(P)-dependent oxidoreductase [Lutibacter sp. A80]